MSSQRYINAASEYKYISILIYNTFCSATFYNDPPMITHAVAQELGPQEVLIENTPRSTAMPEGTGRPLLLLCGPITDFSLMIGQHIIANGGRQIHTSHRGSFLRNWNCCVTV